MPLGVLNTTVVYYGHFLVQALGGSLIEAGFQGPG